MERFESKNEHGHSHNLSRQTGPHIALIFQYKYFSVKYRINDLKPLAYILKEIPNGIAKGFYYHACKYVHPQFKGI